MAIKSAKSDNNIDRVISSKEKQEDIQSEIKLRPKLIDEYI